MNLFLNAVSNNGVMILFDDKRNIIKEKKLNVAGNESELLINILNNFLKEAHISYFDLENLVVVAGPGSFTGVRTIVLMINTINFVINKNITSISYFDLFNDYPIIKASSKRDSFLKKNNSKEIEIIKNDDLLKFLEKENIYLIYGENKNIENIKIVENINYYDIIKNIKLKNNKQINAIYIKKPSIS